MNRLVRHATASHAPTKGKRVRGVAAQRHAAVMRQLADRREDDDRDDTGDRKTRHRQKLRAPSKSLVRTGTMRTSLREFGASIISP
jgi:hypothetical protein